MPYEYYEYYEYANTYLQLQLWRWHKSVVASHLARRGMGECVGNDPRVALKVRLLLEGVSRLAARRGKTGGKPKGRHCNDGTKEPAKELPGLPNQRACVRTQSWVPNHSVGIVVLRIGAWEHTENFQVLAVLMAPAVQSCASTSKSK